MGGLMDAYAYLGRGGVFANAQTGNFVLLGIHLSAGAWEKAAHHLPPILAFFAGAGLTRALLANGRWATGGTVARCLTAECLGLAAIGLLGRHVPDDIATMAIAALAAVQSASFARVRGIGYNSAMTTGNLRDMAGALGTALIGIDVQRNRLGALLLGAICLSFLAGAVLGGLLTRALGDRALLAAVPALALTALLVRRASPDRWERGGASTGPASAAGLAGRGTTADRTDAA